MVLDFGQMRWVPRAPLAHKDHPDHKDHKDHKDQRVPLVLPDQRVPQVPPDHRDHKDHRAQQLLSLAVFQT